MTILVIGATGKVGGYAVDELRRPITYWPGDEDAVRADTLRRGLPEAVAEFQPGLPVAADNP